MSYTWLENLRFISEYIFYADAPALLGVSKSQLARYVKGSATPSKAIRDKIAKIATKMRRKQSQIERYEREAATRQARREVRETLRLIGRSNVKISDRLLPFLRRFEVGKTGSPVYIYDMRDMPQLNISLATLDLILNGDVETDDETLQLIKDHPVTQFFRFMKSVLPQGHFFLTYKLTTAGIKTDKDGMFFSNKAVGELMRKHGTHNPIKALMAEIGTASANAKVEKTREGLKVHGVRYISTHWSPFCVLSGPGTCLMRTDIDLFREWYELNDRSTRREVLEVGVSYPRPTEFTEEEKEEDRLRGADPVTGLQYIWQD